MNPELATIQALRAAVARQIARYVARGEQTQVQAAERLGIPQPTLSKIVRGKVADLSLELLLRVSVRAGLSLDLQTSADPAEAGAYLATSFTRDRGRTRSRLSREKEEATLAAVRAMSPAERLEAQARHSALVAELYRAGRKQRAGS